jgi:hypothetical protein
VIVRRCSECPFYRETMLTVIAWATGQQAKPQGVCLYHERTDSLAATDMDMLPGPAKDEMFQRARERLVVPNKNQVPAQCPLYKRDVVITLGH